MKRNIKIAYLFIVVTMFNQFFGNTLDTKTSDTWITIFVHGIIGIDAQTCFANLFQFLTDQLSHTNYAKSVEYMRADPFFTKNQAMQQIGMIPINLNNFEKGYASGAIARAYDHILSLCPIKQKTYYYTYGWSGLLSFKARYHDAKKFYQALIILREKMKKKYDINPKFRLIGYSHGANVCLNLGQIYKEDTNTHNPLIIDELILLGAPIQRETEQLACSPIFKKIYSFYSRSDRVQKKDLLSSQQLFSKRIFCKRREFNLPPTLTQIEVKVLTEYRPEKNKPVSKKKNQTKKATDLTKKSIIKGNSWQLKNMSPGHSELWFMSWTPRNYRKNFPLYPIPIVCITPYLIQLIKTTSPPQTTTQHVVTDIRPDHNYMIIRYRYPQKRFTTVSFLTQKTFNELASLTFVNKPDNYTIQEYNKNKNLARSKARNYRKKIIRKKRKYKKCFRTTLFK